jgi:hypothetical protein
MARKPKVVEEAPVDPTAWLLDNEFANFVLMHHNEVVSSTFIVVAVVVVVMIIILWLTWLPFYV